MRRDDTKEGRASAKQVKIQVEAEWLPGFNVFEPVDR
jgi:hypothetical protein